MTIVILAMQHRRLKTCLVQPLCSEVIKQSGSEPAFSTFSILVFWYLRPPPSYSRSPIFIRLGFNWLILASLILVPLMQDFVLKFNWVTHQDRILFPLRQQHMTSPCWLINQQALQSNTRLIHQGHFHSIQPNQKHFRPVATLSARTHPLH